MKRLSVLAFLAIFCQVEIPAFAQTQFGTVSGQIEDQSGAIVANAEVKLTNMATALSQTATSNGVGIYLLPNVVAGDYELAVEVSGFQKYMRKFRMAVAERTVINVQLQVGSISEILSIEDTGAAVNLATGDIATTFSIRNFELLPLLNRNPYSLISLVPTAADSGATSGDVEGIGIAVGGARTRSVNFMLDGGENNRTFVSGVGQSVPQDAIEEFRLQTNNMTSEFGRNSVVANVVTKSGGNAFHGSVYEFYRGSGLSAANYDDNANDTPKSSFSRNQFGGSLGGPIQKESTFFFGSFEAILVRSSASRRFYVPTEDFINAAAPNAQDFIQGFGPVPTGDPDQVITARQIVEDTEGGGLGSYEIFPLIDSNTQLPLPAETPLFSRFTVGAPVNAGGGDAQDTFLATARLDHGFSPSTRFYGRFAFHQSAYPVGSYSISPFESFNTGWRQRFQNYALGLTHSFGPTMFSETRAVFNRINESQPLGEAPGNVACWSYYGLQNQTPTGDPIVFPGYLPDACASQAIPSGGPQNIYQLYEGMTFARGRHTMKWGGQYVHMRDNHTLGALQTAWYPALTMQGMLNGNVDILAVAIDPKGKVPGDLYSPDADGDFGPPNFTRHYRYNEFALYFEDNFRLNRRLSLTLGLRWEYFGVLHSPGHEQHLDANLFLNAVGSADAGSSIFEQVRDARFSRTSHLYNQDFTNFAPRFGFAFDLFGNGETVLRGGYGLFYDRNFGNALFNVIQNFPNYAIIVEQPLGSIGGTPVPIEVNQFDSLNALMSGGSLPLSGSARMLNREMKTAYSAQWNVTIEHDVLGKGIIGSLSYIGANGYHLYSLNDLNKLGSCLLAPSVNPLCNPASPGPDSRLNQTGLTGMNRRGNEGLARYHAMALEVRAPRIGATGMNIMGNYTWAHGIDNASSLFGDSPFEYTFGFGFRDPYNPALDRASSTNDIRHRLTVAGQWALPFMDSFSGLSRHLFHGWTLSGIFQAQTGAAFTVFDGSRQSMCSINGTSFCYPVLTGKVPEMAQKPGDGPNTFVLYDNLGSIMQTQESYCANDLECTAYLSTLETSRLSPRNLFRTPGIWSFDVAVVKEFQLPKEGVKLRFNADFLNIFNHANLYAYPGTNTFSSAASGPGSQVLARRGVDAGDRKEQRNIQLAIRLLF